MHLYHFTSTAHLPLILAAGFLRPVESNVSGEAAHYGPDVVWLLDVPTIDHDHGLANPHHDKTEVCFTVDVPGIRWEAWIWTSRMHPAWREAITQAAGGPEAAAHWYVWPAVIRRSRWVEVAVRDPSGAYSPLSPEQWQS